jgi:uncharacterized protein YjbI with pentapeptide repeats
VQFRVRFRARWPKRVQAATRVAWPPLLVAGVFALFVACVLVFPRAIVELTAKRYPPPVLSERLKAESDVRTTLLQGLGGLVLLAGAIGTWRQLKMSQDRNRADLHLDREGQVTERFTRAIDQLGSEKLAVRLGGIYALERIAKDSPRDHGAVMEILTAFVRTNASESPADPPLAEQAEERREEATVGPDVQAVLTVLGRRVLGREEQPLDLRRTHLRKADFSGVHLEQANLTGAHLGSATLDDAHLEGADLIGAHLEGASLRRAHLEGASLREAHLEGANLFDANLKGASLARAHLEGAMLSQAHLEETYFGDAHLEGTFLAAAIGLTREQILSARVDQHTTLPSDLAEAQFERPGT